MIVAVKGGNGSNANDGSLSPLVVAAPPHAAAEAAACTKVLVQIEQLPITLDGQAPRVVHTTPDTPFVLAWGDPAIIWRCGVDRPKDLKPYSSALFVDAGIVAGPFYDVQRDGDSQVWTTVDLGPYISIEVPMKYNSAPVSLLNRAIHKALPTPVCNATNETGDTKNLCDRRP